MPGPITSTQPQVNHGSCAGDLISALRDFKAGNCIESRVPAGQTLILSAIALGASVVTVERVLEGDCDTRYYLPMQTAANCPLALSTATPMQPIKVQGLYRLCIAPPNSTAFIKEELIESDSAACCSITAQCQPTGLPPPSVTAQVTGVPCPLAAPFIWQGAAYATVAGFIADVQAQVANAVYNAVTCQFTAPAGSVFPALVLSTPSAAGIIYCPTRALLDGGYGYHAADPRDPAATVELAPCAGDLSTDPIYIYPVAAPGRTAKVLDCAGNAIGYGVNKSVCAPPCPCPPTICAPAPIPVPPPPPPPPLRSNGWAESVIDDDFGGEVLGYAESNSGSYDAPPNRLLFPSISIWLGALGTFSAVDVVQWQLVWAPVIAGQPQPVVVTYPLDAGGNPRIKVTPTPQATNRYDDGVLTITATCNGVVIGPVRRVVISSTVGYNGPDGFSWV